MNARPLHRLLPPEAIAALQRAASTENHPADPLRRQKAIEKTTQRIQQQYPHLFHIKEIQDEIDA